MWTSWWCERKSKGTIERVPTEQAQLQIQAAEMGFLTRVAGVSLRIRWEVLSSVGVEPLLFCTERSQLRLVQASDKDASWLPPKEGVPGTSSWEEAQIKVDEISSPHWHGNATGSPVRAGWCGQEKGNLLKTAFSVTQPQRNSWRWMDDKRNLNIYINDWWRATNHGFNI